MLLPVATVKGLELKLSEEILQGHIVDAAQVDVKPFRVRSRSVEGVDATGFAEEMLGGACIKGVGGEVGFPLKQLKLLWRHQ